jgi:SAM-dependent methyltransferase
VRTTRTQQDAWRWIPVDDLGYLAADGLLALPDDRLLTLAGAAEQYRYGGWRNHQGLWRAKMGLDTVTGKRVLDYGCGLGLEALQYARNGNHVTVADQNPAAADLAVRLLELHGFDPARMLIDPSGPPFILVPDEWFDVVVMNGVLHHIEDPVPVARSAHRWLEDGGELRLMVYSDKAWVQATGTPPPPDVTRHPARDRFVRWGDEVGDWADWYDQARLAARFGRWFDVEEFTYIADAGQYAAALLRKRG